MRVVSNLVGEFEELCEEYSKVDQYGKDIVTLVKMFGDKYDHIQDEDKSLFSAAWWGFLDEHHRQVTIPMVGHIVYLLCTYWESGQDMFQFLPPLEKILLRETVFEISEEIKRRSATNGNPVVAEEK